MESVESVGVILFHGTKILFLMIFVFIGGITLRILYAVVSYQFAKWKIDPQIPHFKTSLPLRLAFSPRYSDFLREAQDVNGNAIPLMFVGTPFDGNIAFLISGIYLTLVKNFKCADADLFREILSDTKKFGKPPRLIKAFESSFGNNLVTLQGVEWKTERRLLAPLFHSAAVKHYSKHFDELGKELVHFIRSKNESPIHSSSFREFALKGIIKSAFGDRFDYSKLAKAEEAMSNSISEYFLASTLLGNFASYLPLPAGRKMQEMKRIVALEVSEMVSKQKVQGDPTDLISLLKENISGNNTVSEGLMFLFAGTDTTTALLVLDSNRYV
jgi:cytochrome P450